MKSGHLVLCQTQEHWFFQPLLLLTFRISFYHSHTFLHFTLSSSETVASEGLGTCPSPSAVPPEEALRCLAKGQWGVLWNQWLSLFSWEPQGLWAFAGLQLRTCWPASLKTLLKLSHSFLSCEQSNWARRPFFFFYLHSVNIRARYWHTVYLCNFEDSLLLSPLPRAFQRDSVVCSLPGRQMVKQRARDTVLPVRCHTYSLLV